MKIDFKKIDLRQGKYWFPLVLFVPLVAIAYFSCAAYVVSLQPWRTTS